MQLRQCGEVKESENKTCKRRKNDAVAGRNDERKRKE
jgi:hypothetical protein